MKQTFRRFATLCMATSLATVGTAQSTEVIDSTPPSKIPFEGYDLTWVNGQNRQTDFPLVWTDKQGRGSITGVAFVDAYYNYNFNRPLDNTHTISAAIGRHNEVTLNQVSLGLEGNYKNAIGRVWIQFGQMGSIVQDLDGSVLRGRNTAINNLKYIREAAAGYHFNKWYGINVEAGIFMSYIGLESFVLNENWNYQRSLACDFTPFYFSGLRIQAFPSKKLKTELWILNGWQTYNSWSRTLGLGSSTYYRPSENLQLVANFYAGQDTRNSNRARWQHDNSVVARYYKNKSGGGISQAAFSINSHYGFQSGGGATAKNNNMYGTSIANRLWFNKNKLGLTLRGDVVANPGTYLAFSPSPVSPNDYTDAIANVKDQKLLLRQYTATFDVMPNDHYTFRVEYAHRNGNVPYYAGRGGTTSPDGWIDTPVGNWRPDLQKSDNRLTLVMSFRL